MECWDNVNYTASEPCTMSNSTKLECAVPPAGTTAFCDKVDYPTPASPGTSAERLGTWKFADGRAKAIYDKDWAESDNVKCKGRAKSLICSIFFPKCGAGNQPLVSLRRLACSFFLYFCISGISSHFDDIDLSPRVRLIYFADSEFACNQPQQACKEGCENYNEDCTFLGYITGFFPLSLCSSLTNIPCASSPPFALPPKFSKIPISQIVSASTSTATTGPSTIRARRTARSSSTTRARRWPCPSRSPSSRWRRPSVRCR
jgi:hypothetical protein